MQRITEAKDLFKQLHFMVFQSVFSHQKQSLETILFLYDRVGREKLVEIFLENGAEVNARDNQNGTALHWAAYYGIRIINHSISSYFLKCSI